MMCGVYYSFVRRFCDNEENEAPGGLAKTFERMRAAAVSRRKDLNRKKSGGFVEKKKSFGK